MLKRLAPPLILSIAMLACESKKLGVAGSTCSASSDCAGELQCVASTCIDVNVVKKALDEENAKRDAEMTALMEELKGLQEEQRRIKNQKDAIESQLRNVYDDAERKRLLSEKASLDQQLEENEKKQRANKSAAR